ncbi:MAG: transposase [Chitinispirillaceae bacterium]
MCTKPRTIVPHSFYQIRSQVAPDLTLFPTEEHETFFLTRLEVLLEAAGFKCLDMCIQQDHYHLVVKSSEETVSWFMRTFNSVIAKNLNKHYGRHGTVFPKRFSSAIIDENCGLEEVCCHVHLNPTRSKKALPKSHYEKNHNLYCRIVEKFGPDHTDEQIRFLDRNRNDPWYNEKIDRLRNANRQGQDYSDPTTPVIGKESFINGTLEQDKLRRDRIKANRMRDPQQYIGLLHAGLSFKIPFEACEIFRRGHGDDRSRNRELLIILGIFQLEFAGADLARYLEITRSAVSRAVSRRAGNPRRYEEIRKIVDLYF